ncbi:MAG: NAD-dependent epimerase/dehydratase family protein [Planctomycetales bacterium]|nr:NAD-dependent epimerase/dehydratase family protein [Planctomycetales bacterium]
MTHETPDNDRWLIVGCGYVGKQLVERIRSQTPNAIIYALTRSSDRCSELESIGAQPIVGDWLEPGFCHTKLPQVDFILVSVPHRPPEADEPETENINEKHCYFRSRSNELTHVTGLENLLQTIPPDWSRLFYCSTTGVYGDDHAEPVNEDTPVHPTRIGPQIAHESERWLLERIESPKLVCLRLAGIYGPQRIPHLRQLQLGEPLAVPPQSYLNLIHVADIANIIFQMSQISQVQHPVYVLSDGQPVLRADLYQYIASKLNLDAVSFAAPSDSVSLSKRATSKRIDPARLVQELQYDFLFPNYRQGLEPLLEEILETSASN